MSQDNNHTHPLRHRILGAVLLFSLGIIFLPLFFDYLPDDILPTVDEVPKAQDIALLQKTDSDAIQEATYLKGMQQVWSLQVTGDTPPEQLIKQLRSQGYPAYLLIDTHNAVGIGPEVDPSVLETWTQALQKKGLRVEKVAYVL